MERGQVVVIAVVVAALALFGLKVWSDRAVDSDLAAGSQAAAERLARAGGGRGGDADAWNGSDSGGGRPGRPGERGSLRPGNLAGGGAGGGRLGGGGPDGRTGRAAELARAGASGSGSGVGYSGSGRAAEGEGAASIGSGESGARVAPKAQQKNNLVEFLGSQPPTQVDLASPKNEEGEDVALKLDKTDDIKKQGGQDQNVQQSDDGDGIKIGDTGNIKFPNNVNPDAATISFKIQPEWSGSDQTDNALVELRGEHEWANRLELVKNGEFLRFILTPDTGKEADISVRINDWQAGDQHDVQASYGDGKTSLYIDGRLVGTREYAGTMQFADNIPLHIGGDYAGSNYSGANSTFHGVTITNTPSHGQ